MYRAPRFLEPRGTPFPRPSVTGVEEGPVNLSHAQALQGTVCWGQQGRRGALPLQAALFWAGPESQVDASGAICSQG